MRCGLRRLYLLSHRAGYSLHSLRLPHLRQGTGLRRLRRFSRGSVYDLGQVCAGHFPGHRRGLCRLYQRRCGGLRRLHLLGHRAGRSLDGLCLLHLRQGTGLRCLRPGCLRPGCLLRRAVHGILPGGLRRLGSVPVGQRFGQAGCGLLHPAGRLGRPEHPGQRRAAFGRLRRKLGRRLCVDQRFRRCVRQGGLRRPCRRGAGRGVAARCVFHSLRLGRLGRRLRCVPGQSLRGLPRLRFCRRLAGLQGFGGGFPVGQRLACLRRNGRIC